MAGNVMEMKKAHKLLARMDYELGKVERGYTNRTLYINLSDNTIKSKPVTQQMKDIFTGGRGFGLWLLWNAVSGDTRWDDPENEIIISSGPIGGITQYPGAGKSIVVTLSPTTGSVVDSNVGGYFGPLLKFAGWDAIEIQGKAKKDVIVYIDGNNGYVTIEEAPEEAIDTHFAVEQFTNMYADSEEDKRNIAVVSSGSAADNTLIGMLNFSFFDVKRGVPRVKQAGRGGTGSQGNGVF
jgi:aldehyde:ferredoxin oxidoreductase